MILEPRSTGETCLLDQPPDLCRSLGQVELLSNDLPQGRLLSPALFLTNLTVGTDLLLKLPARVEEVLLRLIAQVRRDIWLHTQECWK